MQNHPRCNNYIGLGINRLPCQKTNVPLLQSNIELRQMHSHQQNKSVMPSTLGCQ